MINPIDVRLVAALLAIHFVNYSPATSMVIPVSANTGTFLSRVHHLYEASHDEGKGGTKMKRKDFRFRKELLRLLGDEFLVKGRVSGRKFNWIEGDNPRCIQMLCLEDIKCMIKKPGKNKLDVVAKIDHAWLSSEDSLIAYDKKLYIGQNVQLKARVKEYQYNTSGKKQLGLRQVSKKYKKFNTPINK